LQSFRVLRRQRNIQNPQNQADIKKETFEAQKAFASEKKPSMLRRCVGHDYTGRHIYMITMVTEGRRPLLGQAVGKSEAQEGSDEAPRIELTELGQRVADEWWGAPQRTARHPPRPMPGPERNSPQALRGEVAGGRGLH